MDFAEKEGTLPGLKRAKRCSRYRYPTVISKVISALSKVRSIVTLFIALLRTTYEPPSRTFGKPREAQGGLGQIAEHKL